MASVRFLSTRDDTVDPITAWRIEPFSSRLLISDESPGSFAARTKRLECYGEGSTNIRPPPGPVTWSNMQSVNIHPDLSYGFPG